MEQPPSENTIRRLRRARTLVVLFKDKECEVFNFLNQRAFICPSVLLGLLSKLDDWHDDGFFYWFLKAYPGEWVTQQVSLLIDFGALVVQGSEAARRDDAYEKSWEWGAIAGLYHFGIKDPEYIGDPGERAEIVGVRAALRPSPPLYTTNEAYGFTVQLRALDQDNPLFATMLARRTQRTFRRAPISLEALANCLSVGLQITGFVEYPIFGRLPRKPTPSPGARNPFEAYVYSLRVDALARGFYHYSALAHSLGLLGSESLPEPHDLLGGQLWTDDAAAIVFLVADYDRMMWKYAHASSYRVVLIEAGHIAQNMLLAATSANLATAITAAVCDSLAEQTLRLTSITQSAMYAILIGVPAATPRGTA